MLPDLLVIFCLEALYVAVTTVRWIILVRGSRYLAAVISFFEIILYVVALGLVVGNLHDPVRIVVYAAGYAVGALLGSWVEEWLALGYTVLQIIVRPPSDLAARLRAVGVGVTEWGGQGREGERLVMMAVVRRKLARPLLTWIEDWDPGAFVVRMEPQAFRGGFLLKYLSGGPRHRE